MRPSLPLHVRALTRDFKPNRIVDKTATAEGKVRWDLAH
jgi:hypothetical protein